MYYSRGVSAKGGLTGGSTWGGVCPDTLSDRNYRQVQKHYLSATTVADGDNKSQMHIIKSIKFFCKTH